MTSKVVNKKGLSTECTHLKSGNIIITDAPIDNNGKGGAFSPTDLAATSLASCMLTIMGIIAERNEWPLDGTTADVTKVMASEPRRIARIEINLNIPSHPYTAKDKAMLENAARNCPVAHSLHPNIEQHIIFNWQ
jgi:putative redox protein